MADENTKPIAARDEQWQELLKLHRSAVQQSDVDISDQFERRLRAYRELLLSGSYREAPLTLEVILEHAGMHELISPRRQQWQWTQVFNEKLLGFARSLLSAAARAGVAANLGAPTAGGQAAPASQAAGAPVGTVHVEIVHRDGANEVSEPTFELSRKFEAELESVPGTRFSLYAAPGTDAGGNALHHALMELYEQVKASNQETDLNPVFDHEVTTITRLLHGDLFTPAACPSHPAVAPAGRATAALSQLEYEALVRDAEAFRRINTPDIDDFFVAVRNEMLHQRERHGPHGDASKKDSDWFWLIGYLAGKAIRPGIAKAKLLHHIIAAAAACGNWHGARTGHYVDLRTETAARDARDAA